MSVAVSQRHRVHRSTLAVTSWRNRSYSSVMQLRFCYALCDLVTLCALSLQPRYDQHASEATVIFRHSQPWRFGNAFATLPLRSWCSGKLQALFKSSPKVSVALLDSRTDSEQSHSHVIKE